MPYMLCDDRGGGCPENETLAKIISTYLGYETNVLKSLLFENYYVYPEL